MQPSVTPVTRLAPFRLQGATPMTFELDTDDPVPGVWAEGRAFDFIMDHVHSYTRLPAPSAPTQPGFLPNKTLDTDTEVARALMTACFGPSPARVGALLLKLVNRTISQETLQVLTLVVGIIGVWVWLHAHRRWLRLSPDPVRYPRTFPSELPVFLFGMREFGDAKWNRKVPIASFHESCAAHAFNASRIAREMSVGRFVAVVLQAFECIVRPCDIEAFPSKKRYAKAVVKASSQQLSRHLLIIMAKSGSRRSHVKQGPLAHTFARFVVKMQSSRRRPRASQTPPLSFEIRQGVIPSIGTYVPVIRRSRYPIHEDSIPLTLAHMWLRPDFRPIDISNTLLDHAESPTLAMEHLCWQMLWLLPPPKMEDALVHWERTERKRLGDPLAVIPLVASLGVSLLPCYLYRVSLHSLRYAWIVMYGMPAAVPPIAVVAWQSMVTKDLMPPTFREDDLRNFPAPFWEWVGVVGVDRLKVTPASELVGPLAIGRRLAKVPFLVCRRRRFVAPVKRHARKMGKGLRMPTLPAVLHRSEYRRNAHATVSLRIPSHGAGVGDVYDLVYRVDGPGTPDEWRTWVSALLPLMHDQRRSLALLAHLRKCPSEITLPDCLMTLANIHWPGHPTTQVLRRELSKLEKIQQESVAATLIRIVGSHKTLLKLLLTLRTTGGGRHWSGDSNTAPGVAFLAPHVVTFSFISRELDRMGITANVRRVPDVHPVVTHHGVRRVTAPLFVGAGTVDDFSSDDEDDYDCEMVAPVITNRPVRNDCPDRFMAVPKWHNAANNAVAVVDKPCRILNAFLTRVARCMITGLDPGPIPTALAPVSFNVRILSITGMSASDVRREWAKHIAGKLALLVQALRFSILPTSSIMLHSSMSEWSKMSDTTYSNAIVHAHDNLVHGAMRRLLASSVSRAFVAAAKSADLTLRLAPESRRLLTGFIAVLPPETDNDTVVALTALATPYAGRIELDDLVADIETAMAPGVGRTRRHDDDLFVSGKRQRLWE